MSEQQPVVFDDDNPEWTEEDFARARPASEVHGPEFAAMFVRQPGVPFKRPVPIAREADLYLSPEVAAALHASGPGWEARAEAILRKALLG